MLIEAEFTCSCCGEINATSVDPSAGRSQQYVEDCQVCCRPNVLNIEIEVNDLPSAYIHAEPESDFFD